MPFKCDKCEKEFDDKTSLDQHLQSKHTPEAEKKEVEKQTREQQKTSKKSSKTWKYGVAVLIILLIAYGIYTMPPPQSSPPNPDVPTGPIHWHPILTITINGEKQIIPGEVGLSQTFHSPIHTHSEDNLQGVIHVENNVPTEENMKLGFFFKVWGKVFTSNCILEFCNEGNKTVKMTVNGKPNFDFENYFMHDKDQIVIEYS